MSSLKVWKDGQLVVEKQISPETPFVAGRSDDCDLPLDSDRGISRQHFRIQFVDGQWKLEVLSRYGELYFGTEKIENATLLNGQKFSVPPYEFEWSETVVQENSFQQEPDVDFSDRTYVGGVSTYPYLKLTDHNGELVQIYRLEGHSWVAGRDTTCAIFIDYSKFSRRHFEIRFQEGAYLIKDLGSSNGTRLNGTALSTTEWVQIQSGDAITVVDWNLQFELRDSAFDERIQEIPQEFRSPMVYTPPPVQESSYQVPTNWNPPPQGTATYVPPQNDPYGEADWPPQKKKTNVARILIVLVLLGGGGFYLMDNQAPEQPVAGPAKGPLSPFEKLSPQQQQYVRESYRLADQLFKQGRYESAKQEVVKIHQLLPSYEESLNIEKLADVAIQTQIDQQKAEIKEREMREMEEKILKQVSDCRSRINSETEMSELDDCLAPVIVLNPEHPGIIALKTQVDQLTTERLLRAEQKAEYRSLVQRHKALYSKAEKIAQNGKDLEAISAYQAVVKSKLPDPENLKGQAERQIASIRQKLSSLQSEFERTADQAAQKGDLKSAIQSLQKAVSINPDNTALKSKINGWMGDLKKQMQTLYQEGVLEESVGEVDTAKAKWKQIIQSSVPEEEYFKKARIKLKKYGAE